MAGNRGEGAALPVATEKVGLPEMPFLYTVDQIAMMLSLKPETVMRQYLYFEGRSIGHRDRHLMMARNIAPPADKPEWRVVDREFVRWMRLKGFRYYQRGSFT